MPQHTLLPCVRCDAGCGLRFISEFVLEGLGPVCQTQVLPEVAVPYNTESVGAA